MKIFLYLREFGNYFVKIIGCIKTKVAGFV